MAGLGSLGGKFSSAGLIAAGLAVAVILPMTTELRARLLEVGKGAPLSFIYFQF